MRPDAYRFFRPDWRRYMCTGQEPDQLFELFDRFERKYSPDQPRVPQGNPNGGQWTSDGGGGPSGRNDPRIINDTTPDSVSPGTQYAQNRPRGGFTSVVINGQQVEPTLGQQARLSVVEAQARDAIQRVREFDPKWQPTVYEALKDLSGPIDPTLSRRSKEFTNYSKLALVQAPSPESQFRHEVQSGTLLSLSAVRSIALGLRLAVTHAAP
jgi:hypothetical protein